MEMTDYNGKGSLIYNRAKEAVKFCEKGKWGLKSLSGDIVLSPIYNKIEVCTDFVYAQYDNRRKYFYKSGMTRDCPVNKKDYRFYENGKVGLKNADGTTLFPAQYDEVHDWGADCDVIYVRTGKDFHYYNHDKEEILTDIDELPDDEYPEMPYCLGEDQNRNVMLCIEPVAGKETNHDCFAYGQWCRLSRIACSEIRDMFGNCTVRPLPAEAIDKFEDPDTYIYSARVCSSKAEMPLSESIAKFSTLGCYDSSWSYLLKITSNSRTPIKAEDLYALIKHFENLEDDTCIRYDIAIGIDDSLDDGEVRLFQIHYFYDDMGAFLYDDFLQHTLPEGTIEDIQQYLDSKSGLKRRNLIAEAFWWIQPSERSWEETASVLDYLHSIGCNDMTTILFRNLDVNYYYFSEITPQIWLFKKRMIDWAVKNGAQINAIKNGKTLLEDLTERINRVKQYGDSDSATIESVNNADEFLEWFKSLGAVTAQQQREKIESKLAGLTPQEVFKLVRES